MVYTAGIQRIFSFEQVYGVTVAVSFWNHVLLHVVLQIFFAKTKKGDWRVEERTMLNKQMNRC